MERDVYTCSSFCNTALFSKSANLHSLLIETLNSVYLNTPSIKPFLIQLILCGLTFLWYAIKFCFILSCGTYHSVLYNNYNAIFKLLSFPIRLRVAYDNVYFAFNLLHPLAWCLASNESSMRICWIDFSWSLIPFWDRGNWRRGPLAH